MNSTGATRNAKACSAMTKLHHDERKRRAAIPGKVVRGESASNTPRTRRETKHTVIRRHVADLHTDREQRDDQWT